MRTLVPGRHSSDVLSALKRARLWFPLLLNYLMTRAHCNPEN